MSASGIHIRPLTRSDIPTLSTLAATALLDDSLFTHLYPHRHTHFDAFRFRCLHLYHWTLVQPSQIALVAVRGSSADDPDAELVGGCIWRRLCGSDQRNSTEVAWSRINTGFACAFERFLLSLEDNYHALLNTTRADPSKLTHYNANTQKWHTYFSAHGLMSYWWVDFLFVAQTQQGSGVGSKLMEWGMRRAKDEGVPVGLGSSAKGRAFYRRKGFRVVGWDRVEGGWGMEGARVEDGKVDWGRVGGAGVIWDVRGRYVTEVQGGEVKAGKRRAYEGDMEGFWEDEEEAWPVEVVWNGDLRSGGAG